MRARFAIVMTLGAVAGSCSSPHPTQKATATPTQPNSVVVDAAPPDADPSERVLVWANIVPTTLCFFFAGPFDHGTESSYEGHARILRDGQRLEIHLGKAVFRGVEDVDGYVLERKTKYDHADQGLWETTETIAGDFDSRQAFRGTYRYEECKVGSAECPGPCTLTADLLVR